jgi:hypothetical protein
MITPKDCIKSFSTHIIEKMKNTDIYDIRLHLAEQREDAMYIINTVMDELTRRGINCYFVNIDRIIFSSSKIEYNQFIEICERQLAKEGNAK